MLKENGYVKREGCDIATIINDYWALGIAFLNSPQRLRRKTTNKYDFHKSIKIMGCDILSNMLHKMFLTNYIKEIFLSKFWKKKYVFSKNM